MKDAMKLIENYKKIRVLNKALNIVTNHVKMEVNHYALVETFVDAIISANQEGRIVYCNPAAKKMFGYQEEIIGCDITVLMPERYRIKYQIGMTKYINTGLTRIMGQTIELVGLKKDGIEFPIELSVSASMVDDRYFFTGIIRDITERKCTEFKLLESNRKLQELSIKDSLTNLYNRRHTFHVMEIEFNRAKRYQKSLSCLMIDIDYFKNINDLYGHPFGDKVLVHFSSFLLNMIRSTDIVSRYGGEEFLVILPDVDIKGAMDFAERLREAVSKHTIEDKERNINAALSISVGVSSFTDSTLNKEEIISQADKALYEAKRSGRNRVCCIQTCKTV